MEREQQQGKEIEGFDQEYLNRIKTGFKPLFVRDPLTTVYQAVSNALFNVNPKAYMPRSVMWLGLTWNVDSVIPDKDLDKLHSSAHMQSILSRNPSVSFEDYLVAMNGLRDQIQACHLVKTGVDLKRLVILVLSCCQIIDFLLLFHERRLTPEVDRICSAELYTLWMDLLLIRNQVPFFALQRMYDMVIRDSDLTAQRYPSLVELSLDFFEQFLDINRQSTAPPLKSSSIHHLLHLVHHHLLPPKKPPPSRGWSKKLSFVNYLPIQQRSSEPPTTTSTPVERSLIMESIPSARRLKEAGISFQKKKEPGFSNITFHKGVLQLPFLYVDNNTETLLRNMAAWEQCHYNVGGYFTSYCIFMDYLVNAVEDVRILESERIIEQSLGSEEQVASLFNGLSTNLINIPYQNDFLPSLCKELNKYCRNRFNLWRAKLLVDYFSSPWAVISVFAAIFLLLLTSTQTFYSAYAYHRPHNN